MDGIKLRRIYRLHDIEDAKVYKDSMDYVRLREPMGYHINEWSIEELEEWIKFGLPSPGNPNDLICGGAVDKDGFMGGAFSSEHKRKLHNINESLLPSLMYACELGGGGYTVGSHGDGLTRKYMEYHFCPIAKTLVPKKWSVKGGEKDVYFSVKSPYYYNDSEMNFDALEEKGLIPNFNIDAIDPSVNDAGICGIDLVKFVGQKIPSVHIPKMIKSGEFKHDADAILQEAKKWLREKNEGGIDK